MSSWLNFVAIAAPRNGTTSHTVDPASGTVVTGANFTPTAGRFLLVVAEGAVTSTTPSGWTLPTNGSAINGTGLYVWYKASAAGGDTFSTTHNGSNYPLAFAIFEFPSGTTFVKAASAISQTLTAANPAISSLTGTNTVFGAAAHGHPSSTGSLSATWNSPNTELVDTDVAFSSTDGYWLGVADQDSYATSSYQPTPTITATFGGLTTERLTFAVNPPAGGGSTTNLTLSASSAISASLPRRIGATRAVASSQVAALLRAVKVTRTAASAQSSALIRSTGKPLTGSSAQSAVVQRLTGKLLAASTPQLATMTPLKAFFKTFSTSVGTSATIVRQALKLLAINSAQSPVLARRTSKTLTVSSAQSAVALKTTARTFSTSTTMAATLTPMKVLLKTLAATVGSSALVARMTGKTAAVSSAQAATLRRSVGATRATTVTLVASSRRAVSTTIRAAVTLTVSVPKRIARTLTRAFSLTATFASNTGVVIVGRLLRLRSWDHPAVEARAHDHPAIRARSFDHPADSTDPRDH